MTVKGGATPACAVCKYQRRKCSATCSLAAYFPASQPQKFQNVHRLFGVANVTKILDSLDNKTDKDEAMHSIIFEAEMRRRFPVQGMFAVLGQLRFQFQSAIEELHSLHAHINACSIPSTSYHINYMPTNDTALESIQAQINACLPDFEPEEDKPAMVLKSSPIRSQINEAPTSPT